DPGANVQKIILAGPGANHIVNAPAGVPTVTTSQYVDYHLDYGAYPSGERLLRSLSGNLPVTSLLGQYTAPAAPIVVGPGNSDWRTERVLYEMHPLYLQATTFQRQQQLNAASSLRFNGLLQSYDNSFYQNLTKSSFAQLSVIAPINGTVK